MIEGFCTHCYQDQPATIDTRSCAECGHILIAPSWAKRTTPYPWPERPEGWSWKPPTDPNGKAIAAGRLVTLMCAQCFKAFTYQPRGGTTPIYCGSLCKGRAQTARRGPRVIGVAS